jgi:4'-phosphopantetheinyl transferase
MHGRLATGRCPESCACRSEKRVTRYGGAARKHFADGTRIVNEAHFISDWRRPPHSLSPRIGEVHVWRACLDLGDADLRHLVPTLSTDERDRAARFCFAKDQLRFVAARGILRKILGRYLRLPPSQLSFSYGTNGKPMLVRDPCTDGLRFNLSHSDGLALYAVALNTEVGIDLERIQPVLADGRIAESFFTAREVASLCALRPETQATAFFNCWTAKEAYLKANGKGIANGLSTFEVSLSPDGSVFREANSRPECSLHMLVPADQFTAALVVQGPCRQLRLFEWVPPR